MGPRSLTRERRRARDFCAEIGGCHAILIKESLTLDSDVGFDSYAGVGSDSLTRDRRNRSGRAIPMQKSEAGRGSYARAGGGHAIPMPESEVGSDSYAGIGGVSKSCTLDLYLNPTTMWCRSVSASWGCFFLLPAAQGGAGGIYRWTFRWRVLRSMGVEGGADGPGGCHWGWTTSELYLDCERKDSRSLTYLVLYLSSR